jgi:hypothetical protein
MLHRFALRATLTREVFSPFQLNLGTVVFNLLYDNVYLGQGTGTNTTIVSSLEFRLYPLTCSYGLRLRGRTTLRCRADSFRTTIQCPSSRLLGNSSLSTSTATRRS